MSFLIEVPYSRRDIIFPTTAMTQNQAKPLTIGDRAFDSRLLVGTGKFSNRETLSPSEANNTILKAGDSLEIVKILAGG